MDGVANHEHWVSTAWKIDYSLWGRESQVDFFVEFGGGGGCCCSAGAAEGEAVR